MPVVITDSDHMRAAMYYTNLEFIKLEQIFRIGYHEGEEYTKIFTSRIASSCCMSKSCRPIQSLQYAEGLSLGP